MHRDFTEQIQALANGTFDIHLAFDVFTPKLKLLVEQIELIEEQVAIHEEAIEQILEEFRGNLKQPYHHALGTIPGIGPVLAAAIIVGVGDIFRFPNSRALVAYAGLYTMIRASGQLEGIRNRISKRGSPTLRNSL